jgi:hypothetical protein
MSCYCSPSKKKNAVTHWNVTYFHQGKQFIDLGGFNSLIKWFHVCIFLLIRSFHLCRPLLWYYLVFTKTPCRRGAVIMWPRRRGFDLTSSFECETAAPTCGGHNVMLFWPLDVRDAPPVLFQTPQHIKNTYYAGICIGRTEEIHTQFILFYSIRFTLHTVYLNLLQ